MTIRPVAHLATIIFLATLAWAGSAMADTPFVYDSASKTVHDGHGDCLLNGHGPRDGFDLANCTPLVAEQAEPAAEMLPEAVPEATPPEPLRMFTFNAVVMFDFDKSVIRPEGREELDRLVAEINSDVSIEKVDITGHTCNIGTEAYNQGLSERRAAAVREYLIAKGISTDLIEATGKGETSPIADNSTRAGRAQNRRVEVELLGKK